jgi:hypothetical protein
MQRPPQPPPGGATGWLNRRAGRQARQASKLLRGASAMERPRKSSRRPPLSLPLPTLVRALLLAVKGASRVRCC